MEHKPVQDVLEEAVHMGFEDAKKWNNKELLQGFGFARASGASLISGTPFMGEIADIAERTEGWQCHHPLLQSSCSSSGSPRSAVAGRRKAQHTDDPQSELAIYKQFVRELEHKGASDNIRKAKCVPQATQRIVTRCLGGLLTKTPS